MSLAEPTLSSSSSSTTTTARLPRSPTSLRRPRVPDPLDLGNATCSKLSLLPSNLDPESSSSQHHPPHSSPQEDQVAYYPRAFLPSASTSSISQPLEQPNMDEADGRDFGQERRPSDSGQDSLNGEAMDDGSYSRNAGGEGGGGGGGIQGQGGRIAPSISSASLAGKPRNGQTLGYGQMMMQGGGGGLSPSRKTRNVEIPNGSSTPPSRHLLTIVPPSHLPHDPPHPRTNPNCSGYGPPEHFRRGTLVPLYPTMSSQLAAIAREYGLPSTGGLVLYLLSTMDPSSPTPRPLPGSAAFAGETGPRISEAAWNILWSRLFEEEEEIHLVPEDDLTDDEGSTPPVPPIPQSHRNVDREPRSRQTSSEQAIFSGDDDLEGPSFPSDSGDVNGSPGIKSKWNSQQQRSTSASRSGGIGRGPPPSLPSPSSRPAYRFSQSQQRYVSLPTSTNVRHSSRNSMRSFRSGHPSSAAAAYAYPSPATTRSASYGSYAPSHLSNAPTPGYGASVVVGKIEFDIDQSRARGGKGKWYSAWLEGGVEAPIENVSSSDKRPLSESSKRWQELRLPGLLKTKNVDEEEEEEPREDSIVDKEVSIEQSRSSSSLPSRPASNSPSSAASSDEGTDDTPMVEEEEEGRDAQYAQLADDDETAPLKRESLSRDVEEEEEGKGPNYGERTQANEAAYDIDGKDPLGDVFGSDRQAWESFAEDDPPANRQSQLEITGLGIVGTRINNLAATAPEGVVERLPTEEESLDEQGIPPPANDVAEVFSMLRSAQEGAAASGPLASPIRLESGENHGTESLARNMTDFDDKSTSPFAMSHSTHTSVSTVNFNVRPPSTSGTMSPEYVPQRKQRQGWTNVPAVVDPSFSTSSSMSSLAHLDSQRDSTIGLMENLDDLERALAELSPGGNKNKTPERSSGSIDFSAPSSLPPRSSSRDQPTEPESASAPEPNGSNATSLLSPSAGPEGIARPPFSSMSSLASEESFVTAHVAPEPSPVVEPVRVPRSSSLSKSKSDVHPPAHLVALPPSPLPPSPLSLKSNEADETTPKIDSASSEWSALPPSSPQQPATSPEPSLPPVAPPVEDVAPFVAPPTATRSPGPIRSLRLNKPWGNREFGKSTLDKAKGFFKKSDSSSNDGHSSPVTSPNLVTTFPRTDDLPPPPPPPRKESLEVTPSAPIKTEEDNVDSRIPEKSLPPPITAPFATTSESAHSPSSSRPSSPFYNEATPDYPPGTGSPIVSPGSTLSPTANSFPQPPPIRPFDPSFEQNHKHISSPRSDYTPQTPRAPFASSTAAGYPSSAPVTPADWPNPRYALPMTPRSERSPRNPHLGSDIDQLLSQMNDMDFGLDGDDEEGVEKTEERPYEYKPELETVESPRVEQTSTSTSDEGRRQNGLLAVQGDSHRGILSADLSHLGSMMTGFSSPPLSPDSSANGFPALAS